MRQMTYEMVENIIIVRYVSSQYMHPVIVMQGLDDFDDEGTFVVTLTSHSKHRIERWIFLTVKDFYLTLLSDSSVSRFENNKQANFTVKLEHSIHITEDEWEVCLTEIITPIQSLNISEGNKFFHGIS